MVPNNCKDKELSQKHKSKHVKGSERQNNYKDTVTRELARENIKHKRTRDDYKLQLQRCKTMRETGTQNNYREMQGDQRDKDTTKSFVLACNMRNLCCLVTIFFELYPL